VFTKSTLGSRKDIVHFRQGFVVVGFKNPLQLGVDFLEGFQIYVP